MEKSPKARKHHGLKSVETPISLNKNQLTTKKRDLILYSEIKDDHQNEDKQKQIIFEDSKKDREFSLNLDKLMKNEIEEYPNLSDEEQLFNLYHGATCKSKTKDCSLLGSNCTQIKSLLEHILRCDISKCQEPQCGHSRSLINHCTSCAIIDCSLCTPVRKKIKPHKYR